MGYLTFIKYMTCTRWTTLPMNSFDRLFMDWPVEPPLGSGGLHVLIPGRAIPKALKMVPVHGYLSWGSAL